MSHRSITTPCPVLDSPNHLLDTNLNDTTANIDFTTAFRASFRNVKPKRRQTSSVQFAIHEDRDDGNMGHARTTLLQPARRTHGVRPGQDIVENHATRNVSISSIDSSSRRRYSSTSELSQPPRRTTSRLSTLPEHISKDYTLPTFSPITQPTRPARRGTVYIPNEDTTMPSMYMGIFSPIKDLEIQSGKPTEQDLEVEVTGIAAQMAAKRGARKSIVGIAPRRGILRSSGRFIQDKNNTEDRFGQGGGKENVPPGFVEKVKTVQHSDIHSSELSRSHGSINKPISVSERPNIYAPTTASLLRRESPKHSQLKELQSKPAWNGGTRSKQLYPASIAPRPKPVSPPPVKVTIPKPQVPTRFIIPVIEPDPVLHQHAVLSDDIVNPVMYEDDWLRHQEIAITQLVNKLFVTSDHQPEFESRTLRVRLLDIYNTPEMSLMYKRLQAALFYGALSIPQETLDQGMRLQNDIGLRKQFTDLWLCSYDLTILQAALEVVIGRECQSPRTSAGSTTSSKPSKSQLRHFIEVFLIRNEDGKADSGAKSRTIWSYQRTILRSFILIKLLDLVKSERILGTTDHLFQASSSFKTSMSMLQHLVQMLNPAVGDPVRALNHIGYIVSHVQQPLEEYSYDIENLAVDFRDGIRLTRLVELLLYPSLSKEMEKTHDSETTTILMPEGEILEVTNSQEWPLSQHLKMACQSRVARLWNVQLALSTLKDVKGMDVLIDGITASDIVDGFREKTIRLLWALVGKWGLSGLIDHHDLRWEVKRLEAVNDFDEHDKFDIGFESDFDENDNTFEACKSLLKRWVRAVASTQNIRIQNFTTSFADGKAFEAIVNEYEPYLQHVHPDRVPLSAKTRSLQDRLIHLGCSTEFSHLFASPKETHIFSRDFVLAALAFLCSRLLAPSRRSRAATVIQRVWRGYSKKIAGKRRRELTGIAHACAEAVRLKEAVEKQCSQNDEHGKGLASLGFEDHFSQMNLHEIINDSVGERTLTMLSPATSNEADIWLSL